MKKVFLLGDPVAHSLSPMLQNTTFQAANLDWHYELLETPRCKLGETVARLRQQDCGGANVTIPHKQSVLPLIDWVSNTATKVGAVNTIVRKDGGLVGENTDVEGFLQTLSDCGKSCRNSVAVILGAGGAARAAAFGLAEAGASRIVIINRTTERAVSLGRRLQQFHPALVVRINSPEELEGADIVVNATSVGMEPNIDQTPMPNGHRVMRGAIVLDMVYQPRETRFLAEARSDGAHAMDGLTMLVHQGRAAFKLWTGIDAPEVNKLYAAISHGG